MLQGDKIYQRKSYGQAAAYYGKAVEIDETYKGAGAKYWLAKGLLAKSQRNPSDLAEVGRQLADLNVPTSIFEPLQLDFASLGFAAARKEPTNVTLIPMGWISAKAALDRGEEVIFPVSYDVGQFGRPYLRWGQITLSREGISFPGTRTGRKISVSKDKLLEVKILPVDPTKGYFSPVQSATTLRLKVLLGEKSKKETLRYFNHEAKVLQRVQWGSYVGIDIVACANCDMSLELLASLIQSLAKKP